MLDWNTVSHNLLFTNLSAISRKFSFDRSTIYRYIRKEEPVRLTIEEHFELLAYLKPELRNRQLENILTQFKAFLQEIEASPPPPS